MDGGGSAVEPVVHVQITEGGGIDGLQCIPVLIDGLQEVVDHIFGEIRRAEDGSYGTDGTNILVHALVGTGGDGHLSKARQLFQNLGNLVLVNVDKADARGKCHITDSGAGGGDTCGPQVQLSILQQLGGLIESGQGHGAAGALNGILIDAVSLEHLVVHSIAGLGDRCKIDDLAVDIGQRLNAAVGRYHKVLLAGEDRHNMGQVLHGFIFRKRPGSAVSVVYGRSERPTQLILSVGHGTAVGHGAAGSVGGAHAHILHGGTNILHHGGPHSGPGCPLGAGTHPQILQSAVVFPLCLHRASVCGRGSGGAGTGAARGQCDGAHHRQGDQACQSAFHWYSS